MRRPNLLFVFSDQQRRHALGFMGEDPVMTPHLDRFASESVVFENALACCPICTPNRGIMMTGLYPTRTGVYANDHGLASGVSTIGDVLRQAGYWTGYIGKWHIHAGSGVTPDQAQKRYVPRSHRPGFDYWHATNCNHNVFRRQYWEDDPEPVIDEAGWQPTHETDIALRCLQNRPTDRPFALFVSWTPPHNTHGSGFDPHRDVELPRDYREEMEEVGYPLEMQYHAPERFAALYHSKRLARRANVPGDYGHEALAGYFGACTSLDHEFGRLMRTIDELGLREDTIVTYTSDHGEMLGSHGRMQKSVWFEESIGVPLLMRWPERIEPRRTSTLFNSLDWVATIAGLVGSGPAASTDGFDHANWLLARPGATAPDDALLGYFAMRNTQIDRRGGDVACGWRALRTKSHCYVAIRDRCSGVLEYHQYDLAGDPLQLRPQVTSGPFSNAVRSRLRTRLEEVSDPFARLLDE